MDELGATPDKIRTIDDIARLPLTVKTICATRILLASSPAIARGRAAARIEWHDRQADRRGLQPGRSGRLEKRDTALANRLRSARGATWCRTPMAMGCSPAGWVSTTGPRPWARRSSLSPAATPIADHGDERFRRLGHLLHPQLLLALAGPAEEMGVTCASCPCERVVSAPSRGPTPCAAASKRLPASRRSTSTAHGDHRARRRRGMHSPRRLHIFEDHFYPEIIDPESLEPLPEGQEGELVLTTLTKQPCR